MLSMSSVPGSNAMDLEVVSSKCITGAGAARRKITGNAD